MESGSDPYLLAALREVDAMLPGTPPVAHPPKQPKRSDVSAIGQALYYAMPSCPKCSGRPGIHQMQPSGDAMLRYAVTCHGEVAVIRFPDELVADTNPDRLFDMIITKA